MANKLDVLQGTLTLMVLRTLAAMGPLHGFGIGRRIEEVSRNRIGINYGTIYPALLKLEQQGFIRSEWRQTENKQEAKYYSLTASGKRKLASETREWQERAELIAAFLSIRQEPA